MHVADSVEIGVEKTFEVGLTGHLLVRASCLPMFSAKPNSCDSAEQCTGVPTLLFIYLFICFLSVYGMINFSSWIATIVVPTETIRTFCLKTWKTYITQQSIIHNFPLPGVYKIDLNFKNRPWSSWNFDVQEISDRVMNFLYASRIGQDFVIVPVQIKDESDASNNISMACGAWTWTQSLSLSFFKYILKKPIPIPVKNYSENGHHLIITTLVCVSNDLGQTNPTWNGVGDRLKIRQQAENPRDPRRMTFI